MNVFLLLTAIDRIWGNRYRRTRRYSLVSGMTAEKSIPLSKQKNPASPLHDSNAATGGVRRSTIPSAAKTAHAGIILPHMSGFLAVVDFLALDFLRHRGKRPCRALLGVQFFAGFLAELGAGDELAHA